LSPGLKPMLSGSKGTAEPLVGKYRAIERRRKISRSGYLEKIMEALMLRPSLSSQRRFVLATQNAHGLYEKFGFAPVDPKIFMEIKREGI